MTTVDTDERAAMTDAVLDVLFGPKPKVNNGLAFTALTNVLALLVAKATRGKPAGNVDLVATTIGQMVADKAHWLGGDEALH